MRTLILVINAFITVILGSLSYLNDQTINRYSQFGIVNTGLAFLYHNSFECAIICIVTVAVLHAISSYYLPFQDSRKQRKNFIQKLMDHLFDNQHDQIRITIFKDTYYLTILLTFFKNSIKQIWKRNYLYRFPKPGNYIQAKHREGVHYPNSNTYFKFSKNIHTECEGIAAVSRHNQVDEIRTNLPNIRSFNFENKKKLGRSKEDRMIKDYMDQCCIHDLNTLKRIQLPPRHIYSTPIMQRNGKPCGVLVVDSIQEESPFDDTICKGIRAFSDLIGTTY